MDCRSDEVPKHTLGSWFVAHWDGDSTEAIGLQSFYKDSVIFIGAIKSDKMSDARLIAAAPEMLEALKALEKHVESCHCIYPSDEEYACKIAKAAIAKAEGRQG